MAPKTTKTTTETAQSHSIGVIDKRVTVKIEEAVQRKEAEIQRLETFKALKTSQAVRGRYRSDHVLADSVPVPIGRALITLIRRRVYIETECGSESVRFEELQDHRQAAD